MRAAIDWIGRPLESGGCVERAFRVRNPATDVGVPGVLWCPSDLAAPAPTVLLGHGGSGHKRNERNLSLARWFATQAGFASVAIDGPFHGDRVPSPGTAVEYRALMVEEGVELVVDRMVTDWRVVLREIDSVGVLDAGRLAYLGLSMGTRFGLPLAAAIGQSLRCAVLGKFGLQAAAGKFHGLDLETRLEADARQISAPVLFHLQWDDELFPRTGQLRLFELLGSNQKQLIAYSGSHGATDPSAIASWRDFIVRNL